MPADHPRVLVAHPFPDLYGADLMLLRSLDALRRAGWQVVLVVPEPGPLLERLDAIGLEHRVVPFPVLRKELLKPRGLVRLAVDSVRAHITLGRLLREVSPDVVYVNTLTLPHWLWAARWARVPAVCHVRELESQTPRPVATGLTAPLRLARSVVANSRATRQFLLGLQPGLAPRTRVIYNGFRFEPAPAAATRGADGRTTVTVVGRLSPRKGQDVAVRAVAALVAEGLDVGLDLVGSVFRGYEWYEEELRTLARDLGLGERLRLLGYRSDVWAALLDTDVVAVPSRLEPFGSVAVEALAAARPTVVSAVGGLPEIVQDGTTGLVVPPDDVTALTDALRRLVIDEPAAAELGRAGAVDVRDRFTLDRYEGELEAELRRTSGLPPRST